MRGKYLNVDGENKSRDKFWSCYGRLIFRSQRIGFNKTFLSYLCNSCILFVDTRSRAADLRCHKWSGSLRGLPHHPVPNVHANPPTMHTSFSVIVIKSVTLLSAFFCQIHCQKSRIPTKKGKELNLFLKIY
jgi:hypothetical protein